MLIASNGIDLWVEEQGPPDGPALLLVAGSDATTLRWPGSLVEPLVAAGFRTVAYDHRDCGASTKIDPDRPYRLDAMAGDAIGVLDALGVERAHVVGYSMGGAIAQLLALDHPGRVASLVLVASTPGLGDERLSFASEWFVDQMAERLFAAPPRTHDERVGWIVDLYRMLAGPRYPFDDAAQRALAEAELARCWYPESGHGVAVGSSPSRLDVLARITAPTLVVHGSADPVFPIDHAQALATAIPHARLVVVDGLGHEVPAAFGSSLAELVLGHVGGDDQLF
jgi:pimeloyl-ACP methyl ester carboxylesterase